MFHILPLKYTCFLFSQKTCAEKTTAKSSKSLEPGTTTWQIGFKIFDASRVLAIICGIAKTHLSINQQPWKMVGYKDTLDVAKTTAEVAQKKEQ